MTKPTKRVSDSVKSLMDAQRLTQQDLAHALEISQQSVSRRLSGITAWSVDELAVVSDLLGVSLVDIVKAAA